METKEFVQTLAYLSNNFSCMNILIVSMQRKKYKCIEKCYEVLKAIKEKLHLWCQRVKKGNVANFSSFAEVTEKDEFLIPSVREEIMNHLAILLKSYEGYFEILSEVSYTSSFSTIKLSISKKCGILRLYLNIQKRLVNTGIR